jgi:hypothetical protein
MNGASTVCPRCAHETINQLYTSPVPRVWEVLQCAQCLTPGASPNPPRTQRDSYPDEFKLTIEDIANAPKSLPSPRYGRNPDRRWRRRPWASSHDPAKPRPSPMRQPKLSCTSTAPARAQRPDVVASVMEQLDARIDEPPIATRVPRGRQ